MKKACIISGGDFSPYINVYDYDYIIACDKGYLYSKKLGIRPDLVLGDFDSLDIEVEAGIEKICYPKDKDDSDTMIAIKKLIELSYDIVDIYCALGGRLDHLYANISSLVYAGKNNLIASLIDDNSLVKIIINDKISIKYMKGYSFSVFSYSDISIGVSISGAKYSLEDACIYNNYPIGLSNEWINNEITLEVKDGILLIICSKIY